MESWLNWEWASTGTGVDSGINIKSEVLIANDGRNALSAQWATEGNNYPAVFLHGVIGWGEAAPLLGELHYFGGARQNILDDLRSVGYKASMGPLSSNWERACEAFAQITGSLTDYGLARSTRFGHNRYGSDYSVRPALVPDFLAAITSRDTVVSKSFAENPTEGDENEPENSRSKINLVGHSQGGPTMRMLVHLLRFGFQEEIDACVAAQVECSPLFWTNRTSSHVNAVFAISGAHQGSVFSDYLSANGDFLKVYKDFIAALIAGDLSLVHVYDLQLQHWGLEQNPDESFLTFIDRVFSDPWVDSKSNALFDLMVSSVSSPLLSFVQNDPDVTYFSAAGLTTNWRDGIAVAQLSTFPPFIPIADIVGSYSNGSLAALSAYSPEDWRMSDAMVSIASSRGPLSGYNSFSMDMQSSSVADLAASAPVNSPPKGIYNYVGAWNHTDHAALIGAFDVVPGIRKNFYRNIMTIVTALSP
ncbi:hypothetical protein HK100_007877 [Physocladia obscura]|uniref:Lipase-like C-terminal domain-containing protein n=1 Tax=Physocladia obscura TaxID=109957 RepID=A0AAD5T678_9FUNG|nr:hypothetical protein HK100_007877 [Physocladia obscura]